MSKRLSETEIWKEQWYREMPTKYKLFWKYILDNCDFVGVWAKDIHLASFQIGEQIDEVTALEVFNKDKERVLILNGGEKWFIKDFVDFQYGKEFSLKSDFHKKILEALLDLKNRFGILVDGWTGCRQGVDRVGDTLKDKDKDNDKREEKESITLGAFDAIWDKYPKRVGKKEAERHFKASVKTPGDLILIEKALKNYLASERVQKGFIQNGSTWFNQWRDWIDFKETVCLKCKNKGRYTSSTGYECVCDCPAGKRLK